MNVKTQTRLILGSSAYASVTYSTGEALGTIDFKLPGGRGAASDLRKLACEYRDRAAREARYAAIADAAAAELDAKVAQ